MEEFEITAAVHFDAAHRLPGYPGPCARLHGHRWRVEAAVAGGRLDDTGILIDFMELKGWLQDIVSAFDHRCLNEVEPFTEISPTSENLARHVYGELAGRMGERAAAARLSWVSVSESPDTRVVYREA